MLEVISRYKNPSTSHLIGESQCLQPPLAWLNQPVILPTSKTAATGTTTHMVETVQVNYIQVYYILQVEKQSLLIYSNLMFVLMNLFNECQPRTKRERKKVRKLLWARLSEATKTKPDVKETLFLNLYFHVMVNATNYSYIRLQSYSVMTSF